MKKQQTRLTNKWTKTTEEAYGARGRKGLDGEKFFIQVYESKGWDLVHHEDTRGPQLSGIDVELKDKDGSTYTVDVKCNLTNYNTFCVEVQQDGWLFNPIKASEFICHVNPETKTLVTYRRKHMQDYILDHYWDLRCEYIRLHRKETEKIPWIKWMVITDEIHSRQDNKT